MMAFCIHELPKHFEVYVHMVVTMESTIFWDVHCLVCLKYTGVLEKLLSPSPGLKSKLNKQRLLVACLLAQPTVHP
jgi:hypothetical protein